MFLDILYVPFNHKSPASIEINGHKVLVVGTNADEFLDALDFLGADELRELHLGQNVTIENIATNLLSENFNGPVVLAPEGVSLSTLISNLKRQLPWLQ